MNNQEVASQYEQFVLPTYVRSPLCLVKGKGSKVWDIEGHEYLDFFPGWAVSGLGHCHPAVINAIKNQARKILHIPNNYYGLRQLQLAEKIIERSFPGRVFFCNSGAEAMEAAIKFVRKFGSASGRYEMITMEGAFHGRTLAALAATGKYYKGFEPMPEGFKQVPFNNFEALKQAVGPKTIAIALELIQGEGGIQVAEIDYVRKIKALCEEKKLLLVFDEVQTGIGRTGKWFAYQHYGVEPDLMALAKSLGSGVPIGALVVNKRIKEEVLVPGTHASTYGGNPLVTAAGLAVFKAIEQGKLLRNAEEMGAYLKSKLTALKEKYSSIKEVRGIGLMLGMELDRPGAELVKQAREKGLLINCTQERVLRIMPAMIVTKRLIDKAVQILDQVFSEAVVG
ncbi:MAG: acetylornithine aminotransferase [Omnitrophica bacterium RIFCSPHIGHO2_02_FULL_46_11]|nr:MAG: acetylornithine aminotransferase [Omnitrophica bacterium RIFCSPHIGHO2_02_FULL_46_11]OGW87571.1 MAG: acetylornithine aminotransferase [Omnitrophica bacterium RIFCSPLOWO2_01_FULL_45_10b]